MDFYYAVQGYRQELFLTAVFGIGGAVDISNFNTTLEAVRVTGGERIDFTSYAGSNYAKVCFYLYAFLYSNNILVH